MKIELAETADLACVQSFYLRAGYSGGASPGDTVLMARTDQSIVAAVRLCAEDNTLVLRGMYVAVEMQGLGIGTRLLEATSAAVGSRECWCIPYNHLMDFYSRIGFRVCESEAIPLFLAERWKRYTASGRDVVVMKRPMSGD
jgi:predicted N-acetyltransferase YhbS